MGENRKTGMAAPGSASAGAGLPPDVRSLLTKMNWDDRLRDARARRKVALAKVRRKSGAATVPPDLAAPETEPPLRLTEPSSPAALPSTPAPRTPSLGRAGLDWMRLGSALAGGLAVGFAFGAILFLPVAGYLSKNARPEALPARASAPAMPVTQPARSDADADRSAPFLAPVRLAAVTVPAAPAPVGALRRDAAPVRAGAVAGVPVQGLVLLRAPPDPDGTAGPPPRTLRRVRTVLAPATASAGPAESLPRVPGRVPRPDRSRLAAPAPGFAPSGDSPAMLTPVALSLAVSPDMAARPAEAWSDTGPRWLPQAPRRLGALPGVQQSPLPRPRPSAPVAEPVRLTMFVPASVTPVESDFLMLLLRGNGIEASAAPSPFSISQTQVRFYHLEDRAGAELVARIAGGVARDFTGHQPAPPSGTLELWLAGAVPQAEDGSLVIAAPVVEEIILISASDANIAPDRDRGASADTGTRNDPPVDDAGATDQPEGSRGKSGNNKGNDKGPSRKK